MLRRDEAEQSPRAYVVAEITLVGERGSEIPIASDDFDEVKHALRTIRLRNLVLPELHTSRLPYTVSAAAVVGVKSGDAALGDEQRSSGHVDVKPRRAIVRVREKRTTMSHNHLEELENTWELVRETPSSQKFRARAADGRQLAVEVHFTAPKNLTVNVFFPG